MTEGNKSIEKLVCGVSCWRLKQEKKGSTSPFVCYAGTGEGIITQPGYECGYNFKKGDIDVISAQSQPSIADDMEGKELCRPKCTEDSKSMIVRGADKKDYLVDACGHVLGRVENNLLDQINEAVKSNVYVPEIDTFSGSIEDLS